MKTTSPLCRAACVMALSACAAMPLLAKDSGFYLGASVGQSKYDVDNESTGIFNVTTGPRTDDSDAGFSLAFGYRFNPYVGVELSLIELGKFGVDEFGQATVTRGTAPTVTVPTRAALGFIDVNAGAEGPALSVVGGIPVGNFELFGKVGAMHAKSSVESKIYTTSADSANSCTTNCTWAFPNTGQINTSAETTEILYALGAGYTIAEVFFLKFEWMRISNLGDKDKTSEVDVDSMSVGFQYRF